MFNGRFARQSLLRRYRDSSPGAVTESLERRSMLSAYSITKIADLASRGNTTSQTPVMFDAKGDLFGTLAYGGLNQNGSIFEVPAGTHSVNEVASVGVDDGYDIVGMTLDAAGNVYVAINGGNFDEGRIAEMKAGTNTLTPVAIFDANSLGSLPVAVTIDPAGNLFVLTQSGGTSNDGAILKISAASSNVTRLASLDPSYSGATLDSLVYANGNLYGTTLNGGPTSDGSVFELPAGQTEVTTLGVFTSATTGSQITGQPYVDASGNVYGVASNGGPNDTGDIWEIPVDRPGIAVLAAFDKSVTGDPVGRLIPDGNGNLVGVTDGNAGSDRYGSIYQFSLSTDQISQLVAFDGTAGSSPVNGLAEDASGNFWGTTSIGGSTFNGTLFDASTNPVVLPANGKLTPDVGKSTLPYNLVTGVKASGKVTLDITNYDTAPVDSVVTTRLFVTPLGVDGATPLELGHVTKLLSLRYYRTAHVVISVGKLLLPAGEYLLTPTTTDAVGMLSTGTAVQLEVTDPYVSYTAVLSDVAPATSKAKKTVTLAVTISNVGNVAGNGAASFVVMLSPDTEAIGVTLPTITLKSLKVKANSKPVVVKLHFKLPSDLPAGTYYAILLAAQGSTTFGGVGSDPFTVI